jgi:hypothetical protein
VRPSRWLVPASLVAALLVGLAPRAHATCGAEGCPFVREGLGSPTGRFGFGLRYQEVTQDVLWDGSGEAKRADLVREIAFSGQHSELELFTRTKSWVAEGRARVTENLEFTASVPYLWREHRHAIVHGLVYQPSWEDTWKFEGLGDATVLANFRALLPGEGHTITVQAGVKLPTGRTHVPDETRENLFIESTLEPSSRPGSGSTDWIAGVQYAQPLPFARALPVTASILGRMNTRGTDDFEAGDELQAGLTGGFAPVERVTLLMQVNYSAHGDDLSADASEAAHSAMSALYLTPGVSVRVAQGLSLYGLFQARVWGHTSDANVVGKSHVLVGTTYSLGH